MKRLIALMLLSAVPTLAQGTPPQFHSVRPQISGNGSCTTGTNVGTISSLGEGNLTIDVGSTGWSGTLSFYIQTKQQLGLLAPNFVALQVYPFGGTSTVTATTGGGQWGVSLPAGFTVCVAGTNLAGTADVQLIVSPSTLSLVGAGGGGGSASTVSIDGGFITVGVADGGVIGLAPGSVVTANNYATSTTGTVACNSGSSPCTISNTAATVLGSNASRTSCVLQAVGAVTLYCKKATSGTNAASSTNFDFVLTGDGALTGGGTYSCDSPGGTWQGAVNCIASSSTAAADLAVIENQ